ncbi:MAG: TIGR01777 family oxidoreductase [Smithella sp.]
MKILISGSSGFIGSALVPYLKSRGHTILRLVRDHSQQGIFWDPQQGIIDLPADANIDAVINLSGDNIAEGRWTKRKKEKIRSSRIDSTSLLAGTVVHLNPHPKVFLSSSGIGFYGDCGSVIVDETSPAGKGFLVDVSREWEAATLAAQQAGIRVANLRISLVLSSEGGIMCRLLPLFKAGLGTMLGSGSQYMSWIAIDDLNAAIDYILCNKSLSGPVNMCAPNPVTNCEFTKTLNSILKRPTLFRIPSFMLCAVLGEMGKEELLYSTRAVPKKLTSSGFEFRYPDIEKTLRHILRLD